MTQPFNESTRTMKAKGYRLKLKMEQHNGSILYREYGYCADSNNAREKMNYFNQYLAYGDKAIGFLMSETTLPEWWKASERV
tara:strand:- start:99 stop:344 length:246 start_codon:yes stop_codon:yes gene_type:complete